MILPLVIGVLLGAIVGVIAEQKNRSFFPWAIYGFFFFFFAIIHIAILGDKAYENRQLEGLGYKKCPACAEMIQSDALFCKHCNVTISEDGAFQKNPPKPGQPCRWCQHEYDMEKGNICPACGGLQKHYLKDNPVLLVLLFCLIAAFLMLFSQVENQGPLPIPPTEDTASF